MSDPLRPPGLYSPWNSPGQNSRVGSLSLLQGIFSAQGSNPGVLHCRQILYQLNHQDMFSYRGHHRKQLMLHLQKLLFLSSRTEPEDRILILPPIFLMSLIVDANFYGVCDSGILHPHTATWLAISHLKILSELFHQLVYYWMSAADKWVLIPCLLYLSFFIFWIGLLPCNFSSLIKNFVIDTKYKRCSYCIFSAAPNILFSLWPIWSCEMITHFGFIWFSWILMKQNMIFPHTFTFNFSITLIYVSCN